MNEIDQKIIEELTKDVRKPFNQIGNKIGVSTQTVINRYNRMKSKGIIKFCSISVNLEKIGYQGTAHLLLRVSASVNPIDAIDSIKKISNIIIASTAIGDYEGYAVVAFRDTKDLTEKIFEIKKVKGIQKVEFLIAVPGIKNFPITNYSTK